MITATVITNFLDDFGLSFSVSFQIEHCMQFTNGWQFLIQYTDQLSCQNIQISLLLYNHYYYLIFLEIAFFLCISRLSLFK